ncbi:MAG: MBL fold metallo-hydrolase [Epsilonproteobacteria bacterium]|nr:MBL fold metallo-hydrolase [Campylobacterota bacterium]
MNQTYEISHGAAKIVTGSCHQLITPKDNILIDCGMFQGIDEDKNYKPLGFDPREVEALLLTHGHLDHVGRLPLLYKQGFDGVVYATAPTFNIAKIVLLDSAKLQEEDYKTRYKKALRIGKEDLVKKPLYSVDEVKEIFKKMKKIEVPYNKKIKITKYIKATFKDAGHIIGSSSITLEFRNEHTKKKVVFSGDLGNKDNEILPPPQILKKANALFIESTYGDRTHKPFKETKKEFKKIILDTIMNGGNVIIPSFAIERAQQLLCLLKDMSQKKILPADSKVFLDSPMAKKVTAVYRYYDNLLSRHCQKYKHHPFEFKQLKLVKDIEDSKAINKVKKGAIIIAGSGMCNGGRILHHLKHRIWNPKNSIVFVGYQAKGTLGREIIDGAKIIKIFHEDILVRAKIHTLNGFSAHADKNELIDWMQSFKELDKIFLVHGEYEKQQTFKEEILKRLNKKAHIVEEGEKIYL